MKAFSMFSDFSLTMCQSKGDFRYLLLLLLFPSVCTLLTADPCRIRSTDLKLFNQQHAN